ncbi:MAG TPA: nuclear transport factor 2 family protein [Polyangiaceae bacterium]|jgi:ketosteroid isomerase-like protein|nr:nuclear transport factor 2 family protein [Polyangiaceae bacterium]
MAHPNAALLRNAYALFAKGDVPGFFALCTPNVRLHIPGKGLLSGSFTASEFVAALGPAMAAVAGSFREEVQRVVADDENGCVLVTQRAERDGKEHRWNAIHLYRIVSGKLDEFREYTDDEVAFEAAWHR